MPIAKSLEPPGDRRRFVHYARARGVAFELATPERRWDLAVVSSAADVTRWSRVKAGPKLVFDLVDSYLAVPHTDWRALLRGTAKFATRQHHHLELSYWNSLRRMCARADAVVCSTEEQADSIRPYCRNVHVVLDVHAAAATRAKTTYEAHQPFRLVWEGLPFTLPLLYSLRPALETIARRHPLELHVITNPHAPRWLGRFGRVDVPTALHGVFPSAVFHLWREADFAEHVTACDLAIIPIDLDDPFARGKPENKLLLFWRVGMPVVVSPTPAYLRAMAGAGTTLTARTHDEWASTIERLMGDAALREKAGRDGKRFAEELHSESKTLAKWDRVFESVGFVFGQAA